MTKRLFLAIGVASISAAATLLVSPAYASCLPATAAQQHARAAVIFDGVALDAPTATGVQRFRVTRYLKGHGPAVVGVQTGNKKRADGSGSITSVSLVINRGERWRIFARGSATKVLQTSVCDGSRKR